MRRRHARPRASEPTTPVVPQRHRHGPATFSRIAEVADELVRSGRTPPPMGGPLVELRNLPQSPIHPFRLYLEVRGVTLERAAKDHLGCSLRTLKMVVNTWHRPQRAELWAHELGEEVDALFPVAPR